MIVPIALLAFIIEGAIGFGGTVVVVSLGALVAPLDELLPAFIPINICLSLSLLRRNTIAWRVLLRELAPLIAIGMVAGVALSHVVTAHALLVAFGAFVTVLALWQLFGRGLRLPAIALLSLGGLVHGIFGTGGPMIVYVARTKLPDKTAFRSTLAVLWIALNTILVANFTAMHRYPSKLTIGIAAVVVPGMVIGDRLHRVLDAKRFEQVVWVGLAIAGVVLTLRAL